MTAPLSFIPNRAPLILIVEDDAMMRRMLRQAMHQEGYRIAEAPNGAEGVEAFRMLHPDVVLLDGMMPVMDGFAACQALQRLPGGPQTPVLLITGLDDAASVDRAFAAGATDFITKPIHWAVLRQRVRRLLRTRQAEQALQRTLQETATERERLRAIMETSRDGIALLSPEGTILELNSAILQLFRLPSTPPTWRNRSLQNALLRARRTDRTLVVALHEMLSAPVTPGEAFTGDYEWRTSVGITSIHYLSFPVYDPAAPGRLMVLRDVTEERAAQRLREDLTRMLVHDLRNPLAATSAAAQLLQMDSSMDRGLLTDIIRRNTQQALALVSNILDVSRLEAGKMPVAAQEIALAPIITAVLGDLQPLAHAAALRLDSTHPSDLPLAHADPILVERILRNLISNALKFTPPDGSVSLDVEAAPHTLTITVRDTGPGIPPALAPNLFQKFTAGNTHSSGSGLGLAFCKLAVEAMGGRIWVESEATGSCFAFTLPRFGEPGKTT